MFGQLVRVIIRTANYIIDSDNSWKIDGNIVKSSNFALIEQLYSTLLIEIMLIYIRMWRYFIAEILRSSKHVRDELSGESGKKSTGL